MSPTGSGAARARFGDQIPSADPDGDGVAFELALRFPGQQATDASGMLYNYQREYEPAVGRYSQSDPIGLAGRISSYAYVNSSPVEISDPLGLFEAADLPSLPDWLVDGAAGLGDGISGGLTSDFRDWAGIGSVNKCSISYRGSEWAGIAAGLAVPVGRASYVYKVGQLPKAGMSLEQTVAARNALKSYYRGRPLDTLLPKVNKRFGYLEAHEILKKNYGDTARAIARSGNTSLPWTAGLVGGGSAKVANGAATAAGRECGCN